MIGDFSDTSMTEEGFADKVGVALFPGNFVYDAPIQGYIVTKQDDPKVEEAAIEMVKFFTSAEAQQTAMEMQGKGSGLQHGRADRHRKGQVSAAC